MHRFFLSPDNIDGDTVTFPSELSRQIARVLRMSAEESVTVLDNSGWEYLTSLTRVDPRYTSGSVIDRYEGKGEPGVHLTLYQAVLKSDRFEWVLQKCTELGVSRFVPLITKRTIRRDAQLSDNRLKRWKKIIREAAEQSERSRLPELEAPVRFEDILDAQPEPSILAWEQEDSETLKQVLADLNGDAAGTSEVSVLIGPEGGFETDEVELAKEHGVKTVGLGHRILRAETAAVALTTAVMHELGELSP